MRVGGACHKGRDGMGIAGRRIAGVSLRVLDLAVCELILLEEAHLPPHDFEVIVAGKAGRLEALYLRLLCEEPVELWREGVCPRTEQGRCLCGRRQESLLAFGWAGFSPGILYSRRQKQCASHTLQGLTDKFTTPHSGISVAGHRLTCRLCAGSRCYFELDERLPQEFSPPALAKGEGQGWELRNAAIRHPHQKGEARPDAEELE